MTEPELLTEEAYEKYYAEKGFPQVWVRSYLSAHSIILHSIFVATSTAVALIIRVKLPFSFRTYIATFSEIALAYSSAIIGFLLVSFSILLSLSNVRNGFSYFVKRNHVYKRPLLKVILDHFIFPIGVFLIILIASLMIKMLNGTNLLNEISVSNKILIFKILLGINTFLILLSISELISYFFNIYRFIVITSLTISKEYEEDLLRKIYVDHEKIDILNMDDARMIIEYQEKKKEKA